MSATGVVRYLLDRKLLSPRAVVHGGLRVQDVSRSNRVFLVIWDDERGFVLKVASEDVDAVAREAAILERLRAQSRGGALSVYLPVLVAYDPGNRVLILEAAAGARNLANQHRGGRFSVALAREAGRALALLHALEPTALDTLPAVADPRWPLHIHRPHLDDVHAMSAAALELTSLVQASEEICSELDVLRAEWREETIVHGDVRWENCIASRARQSGRWVRLRLADWELAGPGDPAADVGAFFGEYLGSWLRSIPVIHARERTLPPRLARLPLARMRPALRGFWDAYAVTRGQSAAELSRILRRATRFSAVRLISAALEEAQQWTEIRPSLVDAVQMGRAVLRRPDEAATQLLGLWAPWSRG